MAHYSTTKGFFLQTVLDLEINLNPEPMTSRAAKSEIIDGSTYDRFLRAVPLKRNEVPSHFLETFFWNFWEFEKTSLLRKTRVS